ncbi:MAG: UDP-glucuronosyltransferase, partial [Burkholderiales bacterium]|nr:UDP-glucuronosyltransferase [Burkholderiales bacterium]
MSRILFAWEIGKGIGHLAPFRPVAERLLARGHELTAAVRDLHSANAVFGSLAVRLVQAPFCDRTYNGLAEPPLNYAEILMRFGYLDNGMLSALIRGWRGLIEMSGADLLIADHAPS